MSYVGNASAIMVGGAMGAVCRFKLNHAIMNMVGMVGISFPVGILCINALGGFAMGLLQGAIRRSGKPFTMGYNLFGTGFLGGFTTFSSFSLDTFTLFHTGNLTGGMLNILLNATLCVGAVWAGYSLVAPRMDVV